LHTLGRIETIRAEGDDEDGQCHDQYSSEERQFSAADKPLVYEQPKERRTHPQISMGDTTCQVVKERFVQGHSSWCRHLVKKT